MLKYDGTGIQTRLIQTGDGSLGKTDLTTVPQVADILLQYGISSRPVQTAAVWNDAFWKQATAEEP